MSLLARVFADATLPPADYAASLRVIRYADIFSLLSRYYAFMSPLRHALAFAMMPAAAATLPLLFFAVTSMTLMIFATLMLLAAMPPAAYAMLLRIC